MAVKTINLTGAEVAVTGLDGAHAHITNMGADIIYAAKAAGISPGADGVVPIPAGNGNTLRGISGAVYLSGTGSVLIQSDDYVQPPSFRNSTTSGGSGVDDIARAAVNEHAGNAEIHVTAAEKEKWNAVNYSNPGLLVNSNFLVNQRGVSGTISDPGYFVDCWQLVSGSVTINTNGSITLDGTIKQILEKTISGTVTASSSAGTASYDSTAKTFTLTAAGETISWAKLECGSIATPYSPPDIASETARCQRYYYRMSNPSTNTNIIITSGISMTTAAMNAVIQLPASMRTAPTITLNGSISYSKGTLTDAVEASSIARNGAPKPYNSVVLKLGGSFTAQTAYMVQLNAGSYLEFSAEL